MPPQPLLGMAASPPQTHTPTHSHSHQTDNFKTTTRLLKENEVHGKEYMQIQGEHTNFTHKGPCLDLNQGFFNESATHYSPPLFFTNYIQLNWHVSRQVICLQTITSMIILIFKWKMHFLLHLHSANRAQTFKCFFPRFFVHCVYIIRVWIT